MSLVNKANNAIVTLVDYYAAAMAEGQQRENQLHGMLKQQQEANPVPERWALPQVERVFFYADRIVRAWKEQPGVGFGESHEDLKQLSEALDLAYRK